MRLRAQDLLSIMNAISGYSAMVLAHLELWNLSVLMLMAAALFDGADGIVARRSEQSELGPHLDSLADLVSFGVAPAAMAFFIHSEPYLLVLCTLYMLCGMLRLARYNISPAEWTHFEGLPITASGLILGVSLLLDSSIFTSGLMILLSALMVSTLPYPKLRDPRVVPVCLMAGAAALFALHLSGVKASAIVILISMAFYLMMPVVRICTPRGR
ncbi:MAG: CDP-diacylglycerol--serine O-phosphatidyltransferase [Methanothrix sp.]|jgi:CDP-diacylglycerol--serine O-phosphatidyltransferase|uniref:CDP-diacylglycerol--serine O-phosphatidyltransferase n=1 Tax=Methanothrix sp. TaxID=90426 RepID=UPI00247D5273|nr:CDP-diacylglycerol--serine O-phosphatidyltransferase [Methanothrix sp.]